MTASVDYNNPLAQWENRFTSMFGSGGFGVIGGGNHIAQFGDPVSGASANVATMLGVYGGYSVQDMITKWSGGNSSGAYTQYVTGLSGVSPTDNVTSVLQGPNGPAFLQAMAQWEGGGQTNTTPDTWTQALQNGFAAVGQGYTPSSGPTTSGGLQQASSPFLPFLPQLPNPGAANAPSWFKPITDWITNAVTRSTIIVLGLVILAIGLVMFGRPRVQAAVEGYESSFGRRQLRRSTLGFQTRSGNTPAPAPTARVVRAGATSRKDRSVTGRVQRVGLRAFRDRRKEAMQRARVPLKVVVPSSIDWKETPDSDIGDAARAYRRRRKNTRNTPD